MCFAIDWTLPPTGFEPLQDLHARLQPLLIFFIDAANYIDDGAGGVDPRWELYLATELTAAGRIIVSFVLRLTEKSEGAIDCPKLFEQLIVSCRMVCCVMPGAYGIAKIM